MGQTMTSDRKEEGRITVTEARNLHGPSKLKKKMLIFICQNLERGLTAQALVCFSRWQMPFCVLHKLTKFACSLYLFQRKPFSAFNRTEELLGTGPSWSGERNG
jgi:hypothetical protein